MGSLHTTPVISYTRTRAYVQRPRALAATLSVAILAVTLASAFTLFAKPVQTDAAAPNTINFQARLQGSGGSIVPDGNYNVEFKLYNAASSSGSSQGSCTGDSNCLWTETRTGASTVSVANGYLTVNLGSVTALPTNIWNQQLWLSMRIGGIGTPSWDTEMTPRLSLTAVPAAYALTNTNGSNSASLTLQAPTGGTQNFVLQDQGAAGTYNICIQNSSSCGFATGSGAAFVQGGNTFGAIANLGTNDSQDLQLRTNSQTRLTIKTTGNVGIGTTGPGTTRLVVQGSTADNTAAALNVTNSTPTSLFYVRNDGYIGVGTTSPSALFSIGASSQFQVDGSGNIATSGTLSVADVTITSQKTITFVGGTTAQRPASPTEGQLYYDTTTHQLVQYNGTKWISDRSTATKIVGTSASGGTSSAVASQNPDAADYVNTSTTSAQTVINSAISALPSGGGTVYLLDGTYIVDGSITVPSNVTLSGAGAATIIKLKNGINANIDAITNSDSTNGNDHLNLKDLRLDGNKANNSSGTQNGTVFTKVSNSASVAGASIVNINAENFRSYGVIVSGNNVNISGGQFMANSAAAIQFNGLTNGSVVNANVSSNPANGIELAGTTTRVTISGNTLNANNQAIMWAGTVTNVSITGNSISANTSRSIYVLGSQGNITGNTISSSTGSGIELQSATQISVTGNTISQGSSYGIAAGSGSENTISGNKLYNNGGSGSSGAIYLGGSRYTVVGNDITDTAGTGFAIDIIAGATNNYLSDNRYSGTGASSISDAGTGTIYANQADANGNLIIKSQGGGLAVGAASASASLTLQGGLVGSQLSTPSAPSLSTSGTAGSTTYGYKVSALDGTGETLASSETTIATGNATLTGTNKINITWTPVGGAVQYKVYRTTAGGTPSTTGLISTVNGNVTTISDTGLSASGSTPGANTTGNISAAGLLQSGTASLAGGLVLQDGSGHTATLNTATLGSNQTYTLPATGGTICIQGSTSCGFATAANNGLSLSSTTVQLGGSLLQNTTLAAGNSFGLTVTSDLSGGARSTYPLSITQANNATNDSSTGLLKLSNSDTGSTAGLLRIDQVSTGTFINMDNVITSGTGIQIGGGSLTSGHAISISGSLAGSLSNYTGSEISVNVARTLNGGNVSDSPSFLNFTRSNTVNNTSGASTFTVTGALANLQSNCTVSDGGAGGADACNDSANLLKLNQQYASASGAVLSIQNAGTGADLQFTKNGHTLGISASSSLGANYTLTLPTAAPALSQCLQNDATTIGQLTWGSCGGSLTVQAIDTAANTGDGLAISGSNIYLQSASASYGGVVNTTTQTFAGDKTFNGSLTTGGTLTVNGLSTSSIGGDLILGGCLDVGSSGLDSTVCGSSWSLNTSGPANFEGAPTASATSSLIRIGNAISGGNTVANGGTYLGLNAPSTGAGSAADFLNFQLNGSQKLKVDNTGALFVNGSSNNAVLTIKDGASSILELRAGASGAYSTYLGHNSGANESAGYYNIGIGNQSLESVTNGGYNIGIGTWALQSNTIGTDNIALGANALNLALGSSNVALGSGAGSSLGSTGDTNLLLGYNAGANLTSGSNNIIIGNVNAASATGSYQLNIGNSIYGSVFGGDFGGAGNLTIEAPNNLSLLGDGGIINVDGGTGGQLKLAANTSISYASSSTGNFDQSASSGTFKTGTGNVALNGDTTVASGKSLKVTAGNVAFSKGSDYSATGSQNNVNFGAGALIRLTGASAQTITGILAGTDGQLLTLVNASGQAATLSDNSASSSAANRITTGTGNDLSIPANASVTMVYDSGASLWRVTGLSGSNFVLGTVDSAGSPNNNGATYNATTGAFNLNSADGTHAGVINATTQSFGGNKTFLGTVTLNPSVGASAFVIQNAGSSALVFDNSSNILKVYDAGGSGNFAKISANSTGATFAANSGTTTIGSGSGSGGDINLLTTGLTDKLSAAHQVANSNAGSLAATFNDFSFSRQVDDSGTNSYSLQGNILKIEDTSTLGSSTTSSPNLLYINQNNTTATGNLIQAQTGGNTTKFQVDVSGNVDIAGTYKVNGVALNLTPTLQNVYDNSSSPATILTSSSSKGVLIKAGSGNDSSSLFVVQNAAGTQLFKADSSSARIQIGSGTTDTTMVTLQLDSYNTYDDSGTTCTSTTNQGALYYNTQANSIRTCTGTGWENVVTTAALGLQLFGVVPDTGSDPGDLADLGASGTGPCEVYWNTSTSVGVNSCTAYSSGKKVLVQATTFNTSGASGQFQHVCLNGTDNQPAISTAGTETANWPTFSITAPVLCLADIKLGASNAIAGLYDVRTYTTTNKTFTSINSNATPGMVFSNSTTQGVVTLPTGTNKQLLGVIVASSGTASSTAINAIYAYSGPASVKASGGSANGQMQSAGTTGYVTTATGTAVYATLGIAQNAFTSTCTSNANCQSSIYTIVQPR